MKKLLLLFLLCAPLCAQVSICNTSPNYLDFYFWTVGYGANLGTTGYVAPGGGFATIPWTGPMIVQITDGDGTYWSYQVDFGSRSNWEFRQIVGPDVVTPGSDIVIGYDIQLSKGYVPEGWLWLFVVAGFGLGWFLFSPLEL